MNEQTTCLGLLRYRRIPVPTWRGWVVLVVTFALVSAMLIRGAYSFLAIDDPHPGGILVVEGWSPDFTIAEALPEFRKNAYEGVFVTGGPIETGNPLLAYRTYAELATATLVKLGMPAQSIRTVPAPAAIRDRTYASAVALKKWLHEHGIAAGKINIIGTGSHSRRTRLVYEKAFGNEAVIGVTATPERDFDPQRWWASSQGFRTVVNEAIAYLYARFMFSPRNEATPPPAADLPAR